MSTPTVSQAGDGVYLVEGTDVNWVVIAEGDAVTLIDGGYPADLPAVEQSLHMAGYQPEQIAAVLLTHAHIDHVGSLPGLLRRTGAPVYATPQEVRHARGEYTQSATAADVARNLWRPGFLGWSRRISRAGATRHVRLPQAQPFPAAGALDLPGQPVPVPTPGHTSGHCCYHLPGAGVIVTGDTLVTAHPTSKTLGPQLLLPFFSHDQAATIAALDLLEPLDAGVVLPGHGPVHRGPLTVAASLARERATARAGAPTRAPGARD